MWWHFRGLKWHQRVWILYIQLYYIFFTLLSAPQCVGVCVSPGGWPGSSSSRCTASLRTHVLPPASRSAGSKKSLCEGTFGFSPAEGATFLPFHLLLFPLIHPPSPLIPSLSTPFPLLSPPPPPLLPSTSLSTILHSSPTPPFSLSLPLSSPLPPCTRPPPLE